MDWLDLLVVQGTLQESSPTPQFKSINSSALSFLYSPTPHSYMTNGKTIALTRGTFVGKVMSLLFNTLSRLVITFLPRSECLLISWLQSPSAAILEPRKIKSATVSTLSLHDALPISRLVITFLPRSKHLLISWLQSPSAVILEPLKIKFSLFPIYLP